MRAVPELCNKDTTEYRDSRGYIKRHRSKDPAATLQYICNPCYSREYWARKKAKRNQEVDNTVH